MGLTNKKNTRQLLDFERVLKPLIEKLEKLMLADKTSIVTIKKVQAEILAKRRSIAHKLTNWQKVQISRHPNRPYSKKYIELICDKFSELKGDRCFADDKAIIGGLGSICGKTVMVVGQQKGFSTKTRQIYNFGMMHPEGYRKALRLFKIAEKFRKPIVCLVDTPGAFPGTDAEARGQGQAIAQNIIKMMGLTVPIVCIVIGEGASGGALGIGIGDKTLMLEYTWFTVISPESCSSILWKSWDFKEQAADQLKLSSTEMLKMGLISGIIKEPPGGAHWDYELTAKNIKKSILASLKELNQISPQDLVKQRIKNYQSIGIFKK